MRLKMAAKKDLGKKGKETRDRILEAAAHVVSKRGIENASVTWIAKQANVSRGLVAYYIPSSDGLLLELIKFILNQAAILFSNEMPSDAVAKKAVEHGVAESVVSRIEKNFNFFSQHPHYFQCFMLFYYRSSYDPQCRKLNTKIITTATQALSVQPNLSLAEPTYLLMFAYIQKFFILDTDHKRLSQAHLMAVKNDFYQALGKIY
jgi:AcrR family transcriptional regulator